MNPDAEAVQKAWTARGYRCGLWTDPPGQVWKDFMHDVDELFMVVEGEVELTIHGKTHKLAVGQEFLIPANAHHTVRTSKKAGSRWLYGYKLR